MYWLISLLVFILSVPAAAQVSFGPSGEVARVSLVSGWAENDRSHMAALRIQLAPGWTTYWRAPGSAGIAPQFLWRKSRNVAAVEVIWPAPGIHASGGAYAFGYQGDVVLPLRVAARRAGAQMRLRGDIRIGVCREVCIPARFSVDIPLVDKGARDPAILSALSNQPKAASGRATCALQVQDGGLSLVVRLPNVQRLGPVEGVAVEVIGSPDLWVSDPQVTRTGRSLDVQTHLVPEQRGALALSRSALQFTAIGASGAVTFQGCDAP